MALDAGTGAGRCFLISLDGKQTIETYQEWSYDFPEDAQPGGAQFEAAAFWKIFANLIRQALSKGSLAPEQVIGVSSTSQREGIVLLDENGDELYAGPNVDLRQPSQMDAIIAEHGELLHSISGHWPFPMFAPSRLLWFKEYRPEIYERVDKMLLLNDWILYRLCGEYGTEPTNGVETLLLDLHNRDWSTAAVEALGFRAGMLPSILEPGSLLGRVSHRASKETGLAPGTPVVMGGADTQCGLLGMGAIQPGDVGLILGTYGPQQLVLDHPVVAAPEMAWSGCHVLPDRWVLESTTMEAGQAFRWIRDVFYAGGGSDVYNQMEAEAAASAPGANGVQAYIGPRLPNYRHLKFTGPGGFRTQLPPMPESANRGDFARATLESIAYSVYANSQRLSRLSGQAVTSLQTCGGLSRSKTLIQVMANLLQDTVQVLEDKEGSALGACICAGVGAGAYTDFEEGNQALTTWESQVDPQADQVDFYQAAYQDWRSHIPAMYGEDTATE